MGKSDQNSESSNSGYFSPEDVIWRIGREWAMMLGGARALLMQAAHPLVATGIEEYSDEMRDPWGRLDYTMKAIWAVAFGDKKDADEAGAMVRDIHGQVKGAIDRQLGPFPEGTLYSGEDPELLMWVHASIIDTTLTMFPLYISELSIDEQQRYYREMKIVAKIFGVPYSSQPKDIDDFAQYMIDNLASEKITVTKPAKDIAENVLNPKLPWGLPLRAGPAWFGVRMATASMLPSRLRDEYGLDWDPIRAGLVHTSSALIKSLLLPVLPDFIRVNNAARVAERDRSEPIPAAGQS